MCLILNHINLPCQSQLNKRLNVGFTLIEVIVVMTIVGVLAVGISLLIRNPAQSFIDSQNNADLTDRADTALRRIARDIAGALPNSVRVTNTGTDQFIEFVPVVAAGRYRAATGISVLDDPLDFTLAADTFDVLGPSVSVSAGDKLVIYNLGIAGASAYEGSNIRTLVAPFGNVNKLGFAGGQFPQASPTSRFQVVNNAVTYACDMSNGLLLRYSYAIQSTQPNTIGALNALATPSRVASNMSRCDVAYGNGALLRNGLLTLHLSFNQSVALVSLVNQVAVVNSP